MKRFFKWLGAGVLGLILLLVAVLAWQIRSFNRSVAEVLDVAPMEMVASTDSTVLARGEHLAASFGGCMGCHRPDLSGALVEEMGPIGRFVAPNLTSGAGGIADSYSDGELARAIRYGIRNDGRTMTFMPTEEHAWWPDSDVEAVVSYLRSIPPVDNDPGVTEVGPLGKILTSFGVFELRSVEAARKAPSRDLVPPPAPTADYGAFLAIGCKGCHGDTFSGGRIPGAPADMAIPANITPHGSGLEGWTLDDFLGAMATGSRPDGSAIDPFMPRDMINAMSELEVTALWEYLQSLEPLEFGSR